MFELERRASRGSRVRPGGRTAFLLVVLVGASTADAVIDVSLGEFYNLLIHARIAPLNGMTSATAACNLGDERVDWIAQMNPNHPFIAYSLYRLEGDRLEQIGTSWLKHAYYALDQSLCSSCSDPNGGSGSFLGVNCSDTYSVYDNAARYVLGPRTEVNPWTGAWDPCTSYFANAWGAPGDCSQAGSWPTLSAIDRYMIVRDDDLDPVLHSSAIYYMEGMYIVKNDADRSNNLGWRRMGVFGSPGSFTFANQDPDGSPMPLTHAGRTPQYGPALNVWGSDRVTLNAGQSDIGDDGEVYVAMRASDLGGGMWRYRYAVFNYNFDKQVHAFSVPIPGCAGVSNIAFRDGPYNVALTAPPWAQEFNGADWAFARAGDAVTWTDSSNENPIRWGQLFNFEFDCDRPPAASTIRVTTAKPSSPALLAGGLPGPVMSYRKGDLDGDAVVTAADVGAFVAALLGEALEPAALCAADLDDSGIVDGDDIQPFAVALLQS